MQTPAPAMLTYLQAITSALTSPRRLSTAKMIDQASGIGACVRPYDSTKSKYREYTIPPYPSLPPRRQNICYIEALTDERYEIAVSIPHSFDSKGQSALQVTVHIDGLRVEQYQIRMDKPGEGKGLHETWLGVGYFEGYMKHFGFSFGKVKLGGFCISCPWEYG